MPTSEPTERPASPPSAPAPAAPPATAGAPTAEAAARIRARSRRTLVLLALVTIAPVVASYSAYYFFPRAAQTNYGMLLAVGPVQPFRAATATGATFGDGDLKGRWTLLIAAPAGCDELCRRTLYATRQAVTMQGREQDRVARVWLATGDAIVPSALAAEHPGLAIVTAPPGTLARWPQGETGVYLVDPLGNWVLHYGVDPDIKGMAKDLTRVLKASRIG
jgi:hypothetical protein